MLDTLRTLPISEYNTLNSEYHFNPLLLLEPSVKNRPQLPHHALRVSSLPELRIAEHALNTINRHLRDLPVSRDPDPFLQSLTAAEDFALVLGLSGVDEDPVLDAAILSQAGAGLRGGLRFR
jgi:hypothetical protein